MRYYIEEISSGGHIGIFDSKENWGGKPRMICMIPSGNYGDANMIVDSLNKIRKGRNERR